MDSGAESNITLPERARVVIIGGGVVGCSVAYHLTRLGWKDVTVLERKTLTGGSTFHAAGLVGQLRSSASITQLLKYSVELYSKLEAETGQATGWKANGGLRLACNQERLAEIKRQATTAHSFGLEMHLLSPNEAKELWPLMDVSDVIGAAFLPTDGQASPSDLCQALAKGAKMEGAKIIEGCRVTGFDIRDGRVVGVQTDSGNIECEVAVNCCGIWARECGRLANVSVPVQPMQHQYLVTEPIEGVTADLPTLRDPDRLCYFKEEVGGLVMGGYELDPMPWTPQDGIPSEFHFQLLDSDWDQFEGLFLQAAGRVPSLESAGIRQLINGPEAFTPDGSFILGEAPELRGYFVGTGFNAYGIAANGGAGRALAEWIVGGEPSMDLWPVDIRRFGEHHRDTKFLIERTTEATSKHYTMAWPSEEHESGRPLKTSSLYLRLKASGACFGSKFGWERPNWFAPSGFEPRDEPSYGRANWFEHVAREHRHTREAVSLFDESSFAKFQVTGPDAEKALSWVCANDVSVPPGRLVYTQLCNQRGGIEADLTVCRLAENEFYIVTGTGSSARDFNWIERNIPDECDVQLTEVSLKNAVLGLMGPLARQVLEKATDTVLTNEAFPFATSKEIQIAGETIRAMRVTFVGELGWELHMPVESVAAVYDRLMELGEEHGIANAGYRAIDSLRLEKGYRIWGADVTPDHTPLEAGLGWAAKLKTDTLFLGREALEQQKANGLAKRLVFFTVVDPEVVLLGRETIYRNGERVGWLTSGGFGHTVGQGIGMGYVRNTDGVDQGFLTSGDYELEVACKRIPAQLSMHPAYDPKSVRVKM
ncbi:MAG: FAD-dependent oxidoreductase [Verrucomicrobiota bacterium]|jgi:sarcosine dehydrogenase|nr:FAD-dependent oxidoreductase [Verrucomicrobiota bacterium]